MSLYSYGRPRLRDAGCCLIKVPATDSCMHVGTSPCTAGSSDRDTGAPQLARERALGMLCCAVEKAQRGGHQYLSGTLHNVAKALAHAQPQPGAHEALLAAGYGSSGPLQAACIPAEEFFFMHCTQAALCMTWQMLTHICSSNQASMSLRPALDAVSAKDPCFLVSGEDESRQLA